MNLTLRDTMTENKVLDPFKPAEPRIPGVSSPEEKAAQSKVNDDEISPAPGNVDSRPSGRREGPVSFNFLLIGLTLAGVIITIVLLFGLSRKPAAIAKATPEAAAPDAAARRREPEPENIAGTKLSVGPGPVATSSQLAKSWSAEKFYFRDAVTQKSVPAMVVRLPGGALWGFSLQEPFGDCELKYVTDLHGLQRDYDFAANHPMVVDPCNKTVFDLTRYGNSPSGLVRGEIAQGSGWRPPIAIEMRSQADEIIAVRMEP